jgi:hypothetical protein
MDDKVFNLLEKMYAEFTEFKQEVGQRFDKLENQVTKIEVEHGKKLDVLFDGYAQNTEAIKELSIKVDEVLDKVDRHDIKIQVIEGGKRA